MASLKLSEALRQGIKLIPEARGPFIQWDQHDETKESVAVAACILGTIFIGQLGHVPTFIEYINGPAILLSDRYPALGEDEANGYTLYHNLVVRFELLGESRESLLADLINKGL